MPKTRIPLLVVVIASMLAAVVHVVPAAADDKSKLKDIQARERQVRLQLNLAVANNDAVVAEIFRLNKAVTAEEALVAADQSAFVAASARVAEAQVRIDALVRQGGAARRALVARAISLYEHPYQDTQILLSGVQSLDELATRQVLTNAIQAKTSDLIDAVRKQRLLEEAASRDLRAATSQADARRTAAEDETARLQRARASDEQASAALKGRISDEDAQLAKLTGQEAALEARLNAVSAQYSSQIVILGPVGSFGLEWPIHGIVTQEFGHNGHPGIDIAAAYGSPIVASGTGVVIYASWESGYGNYTCIAHGNGISTCYGHQSFIGVTVGQTVTRGQFIGREGSTGYSTGPHVHFEVRVNGAVHNPRNFVPGQP
ncbi:MAG TPA: peptidoglycan DD-metalloendopeptidase family protein [Acidimicrobiales bacterium]|jgi:murein DD-endopeptidase MepM/ murein hydrolase activator NlpD|nr:peptidoglycan DD-metalloendopeptidase family protein [Acidimicrobiales bacterium]